MKRPARDNKSASTTRSKWFVYDKRPPLISARVAGLNLQGHTQKSAFFFSKEVKTTIFMIEFAVYKYRWTLPKSFDELKAFYKLTRTDDALLRGRELLQVYILMIADTLLEARVQSTPLIYN